MNMDYTLKEMLARITQDLSEVSYEMASMSGRLQNKSVAYEVLRSVWGAVKSVRWATHGKCSLCDGHKEKIMVHDSRAVCSDCRNRMRGIQEFIDTVEGTKKEILFYAQYEVTRVDEAMFEVNPKSRWAEHTILPIDDAPWVKLGQKVAIEVAHHHGPGGDLKRVTTIKPIEKETNE